MILRGQVHSPQRMTFLSPTEASKPVPPNHSIKRHRRTVRIQGHAVAETPTGVARALLYIVRASPSFLLHRSINHTYHTFHQERPYHYLALEETGKAYFSREPLPSDTKTLQVQDQACNSGAEVRWKTLNTPMEPES